jgi:hypothetical protein
LKRNENKLNDQTCREYQISSDILSARVMGWDGMGWDGMGWDGMGWDGSVYKTKINLIPVILAADFSIISTYSFAVRSVLLLIE